MNIYKKKIEVLEKQNEALDKENQLLKAIIENINEAVFATNVANEVFIYNRESEKIEGMKREDVLGKKEREIYKDYFFADEVKGEVIRTGKPIIDLPYKYKLHNGRIIDIIISTYPFYYKGKLTAVYTISRNINQMGEFIAITLEWQKKLMREEKINRSGAKYLFDDIIGINEKVLQTIALARKVATRNSPVLIIGETGTGKELYAHGIHNASLFSAGPFVPINCAAIPDTLLESILFGTVKGAYTGAVDLPGLFEQAKDGTIFLDEINSMANALQAKLLRVIQDKVVRRVGSQAEIPVNCRVISATNIDPFENSEIIRPDLLFRLATIAIHIPPLCERKEDINLLAKHFIQKYNNDFGLFVNKVSTDVLNLFYKYNWPGNVRELENIIESAMNLIEPNEKTLNIHHLPEYIQNKLLNIKDNSCTLNLKNSKLSNTLLEIEKKAIEDALIRNNSNISKTADELGISRQNLHYKIKKMAIKKFSL